MINFKKCTVDDTDTFHEISCKTFRETFDDSNTEDNMKEFLKNAYNKDKLKKELQDKTSSIFFIYYHDHLAGYLKINDFKSQTDVHDTNALELERIYILKEYQGLHLGKYLMDQTIQVANDLKKKFIFLGVWEHNEKAKSFYKKRGFYQIGSHAFPVGDDIQTDLLFRKDL